MYIQVSRVGFLFRFYEQNSVVECKGFLRWCLTPRITGFLDFVHRQEFSGPMIEVKKTPWSESASELYRPSDRRLSAKRLPIFADIGCHVVSVTDPYGRILDFLDRSRYFSIK
jgi:hypothetical protein